ncbi:MAG: PAS domain-containing protein, partial [Candidatus Caldatribacteriaceae bacterium]
MGASRPSQRWLPKGEEQKKKVILFFISLFSIALCFHGCFFFLSGSWVLSWRLVVNGLVILFLALFSLKNCFSALCSMLAWMGLWFVFLGEALFLLEYPAIFVFQESLHGALLVGGVLLVILGFWEEKRKSPYSGMEQFLEEMSKPAIFLDREGRIQGINRRGTELLGYALADLRGCPFVQFLPAGDRGRAWERFQRVREGGGRSFCFWVTTKERKEVLLRVVPLFSAPGRESGVIFELEDITRNRISWLSLYREGRELRQYLEAVQDVFLILDREGKIRYLNRAGSALFGTKRKEIVGKTRGHFVKGEEEEKW